MDNETILFLISTSSFSQLCNFSSVTYRGISNTLVCTRGNYTFDFDPVDIMILIVQISYSFLAMVYTTGEGLSALTCYLSNRVSWGMLPEGMLKIGGSRMSLRSETEENSSGGKCPTALHTSKTTVPLSSQGFLSVVIRVSVYSLLWQRLHMTKVILDIKGQGG